MADWEGDFGDDYTKRNKAIPQRNEFWSRFLGYGIERAFEIGCNWGANLMALDEFGIMCTGCDVNAKAVDEAVASGLDVFRSNGIDIPLGDDMYDMVFTVGVLIHQQTPDLILMMKEMVRLSKRYVLFAEYEGNDEEVPYRGERQALFKREFGQIFCTVFPRAWLIEKGVAGKELGLDDVTYWMYDISNCASPISIDEATRESFEAGVEQEPISSFVGQIGASVLS